MSEYIRNNIILLRVLFLIEIFTNQLDRTPFQPESDLLL
jgi:hypothetical protein